MVWTALAGAMLAGAMLAIGFWQVGDEFRSGASMGVSLICFCWADDEWVRKQKAAVTTHETKEG